MSYRLQGGILYQDLVEIYFMDYLQTQPHLNLGDINMGRPPGIQINPLQRFIFINPHPTQLVFLLVLFYLMERVIFMETREHRQVVSGGFP